jgi:proteic killer suppression protein
MLCSEALQNTIITSNYKNALLAMLKSFRHKGIKQFFEAGTTRGIQTAHAPKLARQLAALDIAKNAANMDQSGWRLHALSGRNASGQDVSGHYSVWVNGNWRLTFTFEGEDAVLVDYQDYH